MFSDITVVPDLTAPAHSLVASANTPPDSGVRWENGVKFTQRGCYIIGGTCLICDDHASDTFDPQECIPFAEFAPYELDLGVVWPTADPIDIEALVTDDMKVGTSAILEDLIWNGCDGGMSPTLATGDSLGAALAPKAALGAMMAAFIDSSDHIGAQGTIYMSPRIAVEFFDLVCEDTDGKLYTVYGHHKVIIGNFPKTHIAGHIGDVDVYLGEIRTTEAPDEIRRVNQKTFRVQRSGMATWNTCGAFVQQVTLP